MSGDIVRFREEQIDEYTAFFWEFRETVVVNSLGQTVLDAFFNENLSINEIVHKTEAKKEDIVDFLGDIKKTLLKRGALGFPMLRGGQTKVPAYGEIHITEKCNLRCIHCCQSSYNHNLATTKVQEILGLLSREGVLEVTLTGGEPFCHPDIIQIIETACSKHGLPINIVTNGTLITKQTIKEIQSHSREVRFLISMDGTKPYHDLIRGEGVFDKALESIDTLRNSGFDVTVQTTVNAKNLSNIPEACGFFERKGIQCTLNLFKPFKREQEEYAISPKDYFVLIRKMLVERPSVLIGLNNAAIMSEIVGCPGRNECKATLVGVTINARGEMVPCDLLEDAGFYSNRTLPVFDEKFVENWNAHPEFVDFRKGDFLECRARKYLFGDSDTDPYGVKAYIKYITNGECQDESKETRSACVRGPRKG